MWITNTKIYSHSQTGIASIIKPPYKCDNRWLNSIQNLWTINKLLFYLVKRFYKTIRIMRRFEKCGEPYVWPWFCFIKFVCVYFGGVRKFDCKHYNFYRYKHLLRSCWTYLWTLVKCKFIPAMLLSAHVKYDKF